jgi:hypothetical protein
MKKPVLIFILAIFSQLHAQSLNKTVLESIKAATVYIEQKRKIVTVDKELTYSGSGFFISKNGLVVTNYHVIQPLISFNQLTYPAAIQEMRIIKNSGSAEQKSLRGRIVAIDKENDLAILATGERNTSCLSIGQSDRLIETTPVWAFGYPFGEAFSIVQRGPEVSITRGTVSALRHDDRNTLTAIQIDAVINPGNSGGPLIDAAGTVVGIVNLAMGTTQTNFAVPTHFLNSLKQNSALLEKPPDSCLIGITSAPAGARVYLDWRYIGKTPVQQLKLVKNRHTLCCMKDGHELWTADSIILSDQTLTATLEPIRSFSILSQSSTDRAPEAAAKVKPVALKTGETLFKEEFDNTRQFEQWEQETGGTAKRTWFLENGELHQFESNELLHALYLGDSTWKDYTISARLKINDMHDDSRAGVIFRETRDGFYLFRIHKESGKAQLAYHSRHPFGWFILDEIKMPSTIGENWHTVSIDAVGTLIQCFLDGACIFSTVNTQSNRGRIGFYSVECKASFDSLKVFTVKQQTIFTPPPAPPGVLSFWFTDPFDLQSVWWKEWNQNKSDTARWQLSEGGCLFLSSDNTLQSAECNRYRLTDFTVDLICTAGEGKDDALFGLFFRKTPTEYFSLHFSKKEAKIKLIRQKGTDIKILKAAALTINPFQETSRITLTVKNNSLICRIGEFSVLEFDKKALSICEGSFGIQVSQTNLILHTMTVSSPKE